MLDWREWDNIMFCYLLFSHIENDQLNNSESRPEYLFFYLFIDIFKEGSLISDPALLSIRALYIQNTNTTRFKNYKQDTLEYISNGKITKKSIKIAYKAQVKLPIK